MMQEDSYTTGQSESCASSINSAVMPSSNNILNNQNNNNHLLVMNNSSLLASPNSVASSNASAGLRQSQATQLSYEATLELYRQNAKKSNDPQTQLEFAKYLIQIAESIPIDPSDPKTKKAHDALLAEGIPIPYSYNYIILYYCMFFLYLMSVIMGCRNEMDKEIVFKRSRIGKARLC
jgi:hypothetical protein